MGTTVVRRSTRAAGPPAPTGEVMLAEPPVLGEPAAMDFGSVLVFLPMGLGTAAMVLMFSVSNGSPMMYLMSGMMGIAMVSMSLGQLGRTSMERKRRMRAERRDYQRYLAQLRQRARDAAAGQRVAALWDHPGPGCLWTIVAGSRVWERRTGQEDFGRVRIGLGAQRAVLKFLPPQTKPVEDLEPLSTISLRRFIKAYRTVPRIPISVGLRRFSSVELAGDDLPALDLVRAMVGELVVFHSPDELRVAVLTDGAGLAEWDWVKWLPHNQHPGKEDAAGPLRLVATDHDTLLELLGEQFGERPDHDSDAVPSGTEPFVVVIAHRVRVPASSRLLAGGVRNCVLLDATGAMPGGAKVLRLVVSPAAVEFPSEDSTASAVPDRLARPAAESLARMLAPLRTGGVVDLSNEPLRSNVELTTLLGVRDPRGFDVGAQWRSRQPQAARLRVPIGVTEHGEVVELDLKESAQGGMGPHGVLIGATGSGKSELLRTLVIGLAVTHSSDVLNMVLVDFKGGATFRGMEKLPHTSALITNLVNELPLVDRMQDSLRGEVNRRQELLRDSGYSSLHEWEKARLAGASISPLPSLLVVVDEFSELLTSKPEFMDLFVMIGRVGRSLGVHLLLASQRLDEGRIHRVEGHLSYRIALRTFSSMESHSVIGVASAHALPPEPGNGYLKVDTTNLVRFKAAHAFGPCPEGVARTHQTVIERDLVGFDLRQDVTALHAPAELEPVADELREPEAESSQSLLEVLIDRLTGAGPQAAQVWLPPLAESPSLDTLLPGVVPDPVRGLTALDYRGNGGLRVPLGVVDRPSEQLRELLVADLSTSDGHVGVVGAPQTGKSTLLRTLMLSLALTHTPEEVQFYCLDFGGGLASASGLPHVGSVAARLDRDRVVRTVEELTQVLERREMLFAQHGFESMPAFRAARAEGLVLDPYGDVFLVVDGWYTLRQDFDELEQRVVALGSRGLSFGLHVVVSAARWSEIRPSLRDLIGTKLELRLGDALESDVGSRIAAGVPRRPGAGLTSAGHHFLAALPRLDGRSTTGDLSPATKSATADVDAFWTGEPAPGVRLLPTVLPVSDLPAPEGDFRVCIGLDEQRLAPVWHDFSATPHLMVFGDGETGKTTVLRTIAGAITRHHGPDQARILVGDQGRQLHDVVPEAYRIGYAVSTDALTDLAANAEVSMTKRLPGPDITPERLSERDWWSGPRLFLLIDDYDLFATTGGGMQCPMNPLVSLLAQGANIGMHVVVARSTSSAMRAMMDPLLRRIWELGNPALLLSYPREEGKFLGEAVPRTLPPGRAQLVTRRGTRLVQTPIAARESGGTPR